MNYRDLQMVDNVHVFLDVSIDDIKCGRVVVELFKQHVPKTVENFRALCTGEKGIGGLKVPLHYKNSIFHKAVPQCLVQGGDITNNDGTGGESIYGPHFADEKLDIMHSEAGLLSMANCGIPDTNNSQFCITLDEAHHLDGAHVVFGRVVKGFNIINDISYQPFTPDYKPIPVCKIWDCGELRPGQDWGYCANDFSDIYPPHPEDWECQLPALEVSDIIDVVTKIKYAGNQYFKTNDSVNAHQKYKKALRYLNWYMLNHPDDWEGVLEVMTQCKLNAALACIKIDRHREAINLCNEIPDVDRNPKALFRRGLALASLNDHDDALRDLRAAHELAPSDSTISAEIKRIQRFLKSYKRNERSRVARMFET